MCNQANMAVTTLLFFLVSISRRFVNWSGFAMWGERRWRRWRRMRRDGGGRERGTLSVCARVCREGQGNKSEQREVMRFGWRAAVINTTLGSNNGHTFAQVGWENTMSCYQSFLSFPSSEPSFTFHFFCFFVFYPRVCLTSCLPLVDFYQRVIECLRRNDFLKIISLIVIVPFLRFPSFPQFLCFNTYLHPSSPLHQRAHTTFSSVCKIMCVQTQQCPVQPQLLNI